MQGQTHQSMHKNENRTEKKRRTVFRISSQVSPSKELSYISYIQDMLVKRLNIREEREWIKETFMTTGSAFTGDFKFTINKNPQPSNRIAISMTSTATSDFHKISTELNPTHLTQLFARKQDQPIFIHPTSHLPLECPINSVNQKSRLNPETEWGRNRRKA